VTRKRAARGAALRILWEYRVRPDRRADFELHYRPGGTWGEFFRPGRGYRGTILLRDRDEAGRYMTLDLWDDLESHRAFSSAHADEYKRIDRICGALTFEERCLGYFETIGGDSVTAILGSSRARGGRRRSAPSRRKKRS